MFSGLIQKFKEMISSSSGPLEQRVTTYGQSDYSEDDLSEEEVFKKIEELKWTVYDCLRTIRDPEKPASLEDLKVVYEDGIQVSRDSKSATYTLVVEFNPTVPHCSLATLIGLCIRVKLEKSLTEKFKLDIFVKKGSHDTEEEINKQVNDKERVAAAMENPALRDIVDKCIKEEY